MWLNMLPTWMNEKRFSTTTLREGGRRMHFSRARARVSGEGEKHRSSALLVFQVGRETEEGGVEGVVLLFWNFLRRLCGKGGRQGWGEIIAVSIRTRKKIRR